MDFCKLGIYNNERFIKVEGVNTVLVSHVESAKYVFNDNDIFVETKDDISSGIVEDLQEILQQLGIKEQDYPEIRIFEVRTIPEREMKIYGAAKIDVAMKK